MEELPFPCILLAAGSGSRMGGGKLLLPLGGESAIRRSARIALSVCPYVVAVLGCGAGEAGRALEGFGRIEIVENPDWRAGMVGSAQAGVRALAARMAAGEPIEGFFLHHADMPFAESEAYAALAAAWAAWKGERRPVFASARKGRRGHPVLFPASLIPSILAHGPGERLADLLAAAGCALVETGCDGVFEDLDEPEDYKRLLSKYGLEDSVGLPSPA